MFELPTVADLRAIADRLGMSASDDDLTAARSAMRPIAETYAVLDGVADDLPVVRYSRTWSAVRRNAGAGNAWAVLTTIARSPSGPLAGKRIALKDNICVAGIPMRNGGALPETFVPDIDATVVTRILDAGGEIAGKATCEYGCVSGGSHTGMPGPIDNPHRRGHSAGGSSSGSAVLVATGEADMALGGDQGGSIRIPSSYCGVYGLKPTFGLVPYTGIVGLEPSIDHCGPMTATVSDNALLLGVIAGPDGLDGRQRDVHVGAYGEALDKGAEGLRIGVLSEGFAAPGSDPRVDAKVLAASERLRGLGASVEAVSIPWHLNGTAVWSPITHDGGFLSMWAANGVGIGWEGVASGSLAAASASWRDAPDDLADTVKVMMLFGHSSLARYHGRYLAKAENLRRRLRAAYDAAFEHLDLLLMPTMPTTAPILPAADSGLEAGVRASWPMASNLCAFNASGHPALSAPCGMIDGLPVGLMLVARRFDETSIYRAARALESAWDWKSL